MQAYVLPLRAEERAPRPHRHAHSEVPMEMVVFGLSVRSSWGNGHATLWRGLIHALAREGHRVVFYEWDAPYYAPHRDCFGLPNGELRLYSDFADVRHEAAERLRTADVAMVTSYCPHGLEATDLVLESRVSRKVFYDLDTPITLARLARGEHVAWLGPRGLSDFDLVLSYTGGRALTELARVLGARRVVPIYGSVDPELHAPTAPSARYRADLAYLGTYADERQAALNELLLLPAALCSERTFAIGGSQYPLDFPWRDNIYYHFHVPPAEHAAFYSSARLNLNVTRAPMAELGYCPSGRLFEAAACGAALISDAWEGLSEFYEPESELLVARDRHDVVAALSLGDAQLQAMARRARERTLTEHTTYRRARQLVEALALTPSQHAAPATRTDLISLQTGE
jgi:spore maturation protein CgeB